MNQRQNKIFRFLIIFIMETYAVNGGLMGQNKHIMESDDRKVSHNRSQVSLPLKHLMPTSPYGWRIHPTSGLLKFHNGIDLRAHQDTVYAIYEGTVLSTGYHLLLGNYIAIEHVGFESIYGHLSQVLIAPEQTVQAGVAIAVTGSTGNSTGEHLHFTVRCNNKYINPLQFLKLLILRNYNQNR